MTSNEKSVVLKRIINESINEYWNRVDVYNEELKACKTAIALNIKVILSVAAALDFIVEDDVRVILNTELSIIQGQEAYNSKELLIKKDNFTKNDIKCRFVLYDILTSYFQNYFNVGSQEEAFLKVSRNAYEYGMWVAINFGLALNLLSAEDSINYARALSLKNSIPRELSNKRILKEKEGITHK